MSKQNPQIDIAVLKEQVNTITKSIVSIQSDITLINNKLDDTYLRKTDHKIFSDANQATHVDFDKRVSALENWRWYIAGALALFGFIAILLVTLYK